MKKTLSIILTTAIIFLIITPIKPSAISLQCNDSDVNIHLEKFQEIYSTDSTQLTAYVLKSVENNELDRHVALNALLAIFQQNEHDYAIIEALSWLVATDEMQSSLTEDELDILRDIMSPPSYNKTYITGDIEIRYTYSSDTVPQFVISLATAIYQAETSLISGLSLNRPRSNVITNRFHFYIINATSPGVSNQGEAYTIPEYTLGFRTSYSVFPNVSSSQMVSNLITYQKGSAVHEYTHAITHDYINIGT
ncbi:MAG: hypothetical protein J5879_10175, partial [Clostridia bacterium]|nr:hypothetical protein [Clostridia bacterium]